MRKLLAFLLVAVLIFATAVAFVGCDGCSESENGEVIGLQEAYEKEYLTQEDLLSIAYYYQGTKNNEELMGEDYVPKHKEPETLNEKIAEKIIEVLKKKTEQDYIEIASYLGTYNNCVIVKYMDGQQYVTVEPMRHLVKIGGVTFSFWTPEIEKLSVYVYKK